MSVGGSTERLENLGTYVTAAEVVPAPAAAEELAPPAAAEVAPGETAAEPLRQEVLVPARTVTACE
jgi:hypothetical protein